MALLIDCNIHSRVLEFLYYRATIDWNLKDWLRGISLICGVMHPYKHVCNIVWRTFFLLFVYIAVPVIWFQNASVHRHHVLGGVT